MAVKTHRLFTIHYFGAKSKKKKHRQKKIKKIVLIEMLKNQGKSAKISMG